ncbi:MAG: hypothetical protein Q9181_005021, partial [Wetmoreana brouardii]
MSVSATQSKISAARAYLRAKQDRRSSGAYGALWSAGLRDKHGNLPSGSEILFGPSKERLAILPEWYRKPRSGTSPSSEPVTEYKPEMARCRAYLEDVARDALRLLPNSQSDSSDVPLSNRLDTLMEKADATTRHLEHRRSDFHALQDDIHVEQVTMELDEALGEEGRCSDLGEEPCAFGADSDDEMSDASSTDYEGDDEESITDRRELQEVRDDNTAATYHHDGDNHFPATSSVGAGNGQPVVLRLRGGDAPTNHNDDVRWIADLQRRFRQSQGNRAPPARRQRRSRRVPPTVYQQEVRRLPVNPGWDHGPLPIRLRQDNHRGPIGAERALSPPRGDVVRGSPGEVVLSGSWLTAGPRVSPPADWRMTESRPSLVTYLQYQAQPPALTDRRQVGQAPSSHRQQERNPGTLAVPDSRT